jgi:hypothetical protein
MAATLPTVNYVNKKSSRKSGNLCVVADTKEVRQMEREKSKQINYKGIKPV